MTNPRNRSCLDSEPSGQCQKTGGEAMARDLNGCIVYLWCP
jgi:hypothetical protein